MRSLKGNRKGFTLVELIIVIAIIAILAVVIAPQYLKYVEKSRESVDENAVAEIAHAAEIISLSGEIIVYNAKITLKIDENGVATIGEVEGDNEKLADVVKGILNPVDHVFTSKLYQNKEIEITITSGLVEWTKPTA